MRNRLVECSVASLIAALALPLLTVAQTSQPRQTTDQQSAAAPVSTAGASQGATEIEGKGGQMPHYKYAGPPGPAPKQDLSGEWGGPLSAAKVDPAPPMTAWGQERFAANKSNQKINVADSNDPLDTCDPLGFPRNALWESRGIAFAKMPDKVVELFQYEKVWREIWTDGRALPKNVGSDILNSPDSRYYGYSVGHWDGDYTLVVDTVGLDDSTWLDNAGHPHSGDLHVNERYTRVDQHTLEMTVTLDDPKVFTRPWMAGETTFKWIPEQQFDEQLCIPSHMQDYFKLLANPAAGVGTK
jgi:hypothetical protein